MPGAGKVPQYPNQRATVEVQPENELSDLLHEFLGRLLSAQLWPIRHNQDF